MSASKNTKTTTTSEIFCEFFEVAVHNILHSRKVYPESIFERKRKYGAPVYRSVHPDVNAYIEGCVRSIHFHLKNNQLRKIFLCVRCEGRLVEKFVFEVIFLNDNIDSDPFLVRLEQNLRDFCLKLNASGSYLNELSGDATFCILLDVTEYTSLEYNQSPALEDFPWIALDADDLKLDQPEIVPLHTVETEFFALQMYIEKPSTDNNSQDHSF